MAAQLGTFAEERDKAKAGRKKKRREGSPSSEKKRKKKGDVDGGDELNEKEAKRRKLVNDTHHSCHHHHHHHHHKHHHHHHHVKEELPQPAAPVHPISPALFTLPQLDRPRDKSKKKHRDKKENGGGESPLRPVKKGASITTLLSKNTDNTAVWTLSERPFSSKSSPCCRKTSTTTQSTNHTSSDRFQNWKIFHTLPQIFRVEGFLLDAIISTLLGDRPLANSKEISGSTNGV